MHHGHNHAQGLQPPFSPHTPSWAHPTARTTRTDALMGCTPPSHPNPTPGAACTTAITMHRGCNPYTAPQSHPGLTPLHAPHALMHSSAASPLYTPEPTPRAACTTAITMHGGCIPPQPTHPILGSPHCMHCSRHHAWGLQPPFSPQIASWAHPAACTMAITMHGCCIPPSAPHPPPRAAPPIAALTPEPQ